MLKRKASIEVEHLGAMAVIIAILAAVILIPMACINGCVPNYSDGNRIGVVTKFSHKGFMMKSWEGDLQVMGASSTDIGMASVQFHFSVQDDAVAKELQQAMTNGSRIKVVYRQYWLSPVTIDTEFVVTAVEILK